MCPMPWGSYCGVGGGVLTVNVGAESDARALMEASA